MNDTTQKEYSEIIARAILDGQNQIHDLTSGRATAEEIEKRMQASHDFFLAKLSRLDQERVEKVRGMKYIEAVMPGEDAEARLAVKRLHNDILNKVLTNVFNVEK